MRKASVILNKHTADTAEHVWIVYTGAGSYFLCRDMEDMEGGGIHRTVLMVVWTALSICRLRNVIEFNRSRSRLSYLQTFNSSEV